MRLKTETANLQAFRAPWNTEMVICISTPFSTMSQDPAVFPLNNEGVSLECRMAGLFSENGGRMGGLC